MGKCKYCGAKTVWGGQRVCGACMRKWKERRIAAYNQAIEELGPLTAENHKALLKRTKKLERTSGEKP